MSSRFIRVVACVRMSFHFKVDSYSIVGIDDSLLSVHLSMGTGGLL